MRMSDIATGLQHIGIPTDNLAAMVDFYTRLGFEVAHRAPHNGSEVFFLRLGDLMIETYETSEPAGRTGAIDHIAVNVTDIEAARRVVEEMGLEIVEEGRLAFWENGVRYFIVPGPNQERLEFNQYL